MKLTVEQLREWGADNSFIKWFNSQDERDDISVVRKLMEKNIRLANWLIVCLLPVKDRPKYALYAAELAYNNSIIKQAFDLVKKYIEDPKSVSVRELSHIAANMEYWDDYSSDIDDVAQSIRDAVKTAEAVAKDLNDGISSIYANSATTAINYTSDLQKIIEYGISLLGTAK